MATKDRDAFDYLGAFNQTRAASAAKEQAAATARIAEAQLAQAKAAQEIASAQAEAHRSAAMADQNRAKIESELFNREKRLRFAKSEIIRIAKSLSSLDDDLGNISGSQLAKVIADEVNYSESKSQILNDLGFEADAAEIESNMHTIQSIETLLSNLDSNKKYTQARVYVKSAIELKSLKDYLDQLSRKISELKTSNQNTRDEIERCYGEWTNSNPSFPTEEAYKISLSNSKESRSLDEWINKKINFNAALLGLVVFGFGAAFFTEMGYTGLIVIAAAGSYFIFKGKIQDKIDTFASITNQKTDLYSSYLNGSKTEKDLIAESDQLISAYDQSLIKLSEFGETQVKGSAVPETAYDQFVTTASS